MPFPSKPLPAGAQDLKSWVDCTHFGALHIKQETHLGRRIKQRYAILAKGYLYIFMDMSSRKSEHIYNLNECYSAVPCDSEDDEDRHFFSFNLLENDKKPIVFCCDKAEERKIWLEKIRSVILEWHPNLSADSGYGGSASSTTGTVFGNQSSQTDNYTYVENDWGRKRKTSVPVQISGAPERLVENTQETVPKRVCEPERDQLSFCGRNDSAFNSVRPGIDSYCLQESLSHLSVRSGQESLNQTTDSRSATDWSSGVTENFEMPSREDYHRQMKFHVKRAMQGKPEGAYFVYSGHETRLAMCVVTPNGRLKYFRIFEQDGRLSLYKTFPDGHVFPTVEKLLSFYHENDLSVDGYNVRLKKKVVA